jgi:hypothetical protein
LNIPGETPLQTLALKLFAAFFIALLGHHASDCPANCPGTNDQGKPRPWQRSLFPLLAVLIVCVLWVVALAGCAVPNPGHRPGDTNSPAYIVDPRLVAVSNTASGLAGPVGEATGTGPLAGYLVACGFGIAGALSQLWARHKSQVADALAAGVAQQGPAVTAAVMAHASDGPKFAAVAQALNEQLATGQSPGQVSQAAGRPAAAGRPVTGPES